MITARSLITAIKTAEWHRYTGAAEQGYATAGTTGPDAIDMRCPIPLDATDPPQFIEYRRVDGGGPEWEYWQPTGYAAVMRYDSSRDHEQDGEGYEFIPYMVTQLSLAS